MIKNMLGLKSRVNLQISVLVDYFSFYNLFFSVMLLFGYQPGPADLSA